MSKKLLGDSLDIEERIHIAGHLAVDLDNVLDVHIDEVVEGVYVLLHQALHTQECRHKLPFVLKPCKGDTVKGSNIGKTH